MLNIGSIIWRQFLIGFLGMTGLDVYFKVIFAFLNLWHYILTQAENVLEFPKKLFKNF